MSEAYVFQLLNFNYQMKIEIPPNFQRENNLIANNYNVINFL